MTVLCHDCPSARRSNKHLQSTTPSLKDLGSCPAQIFPHKITPVIVRFTSSQVWRVSLHRCERRRWRGRGWAEEEDLRDEEDAGGPVRHGHPEQSPPEERVRHLLFSFFLFKNMNRLRGNVRLTHRLVGAVCVDRLRPQDTERRAQLWKHLQSLLETYCHLQQNDQSFLVEVKRIPASHNHIFYCQKVFKIIIIILIFFYCCCYYHSYYFGCQLQFIFVKYPLFFKRVNLVLPPRFKSCSFMHFQPGFCLY